MLQVSITITGSARAKKKLKRLGSSLYNFDTAMDKIGEEGARYFSGVAFASQGGVFGSKWPALSSKYAAIKAKLYPGKGILIASESMIDSFDYQAYRTQVVIGNTDPKFKYHQSTAPRKKIPRRQMIGVNSAIQKIVNDIIYEDVAQKIRRA